VTAFSNFLQSFDPATKGGQFEHFVKWFLENDPEWSTQVDQIWLWDDYPERWGRDCGVDLVFKHKNNDIWAVQAKCYSPEYSITKADVDKFLSESNRNGIDKRLLIATTDQIGQNALQVCNAQEKPVTRFLFSDFEKAAIEYPAQIADLNTAQRKARPIPRPHQLEAIDEVEKGFIGNDRGQLIMACGTGKTFTTLWVKERRSAQSTLVLLPSLSLLSQTLREWTFASNKPFDVLCVCSDQSVGKQSSPDEIIHSVKELSFPVTSDQHEISAFLKGSGDKVIFSTYQSSPMIAEAQRDTDVPAFDLVIADEAHRCTGSVGNAFTTVLDQSLIRSHKRLFTTATPKTYSANLKKKASEKGVDVTGMDDETIFGKALYTLTFGEAIDRGLLTDYQVVLVGVDNPMIANWIQRRQFVQTVEDTTIDAKALASQIGLIKAIKDYDLKRVISFHSRVKRAETFASEIQASIDLIEEENRPHGTIWTDYVSGAMPTYKRRLKLDQLKKLTKSDRGLLSNAKCLAEGVDVPSLDGVAFIDPRASQVDIVQAVGRAIRLSDNKTIGTIVLPVFIEDGDNVELSMQSSAFKPIWEVLNALKAHDEVLAFELDKYRTDMGKGHASIGSNGGFSKIVFDLPTTIDKSFSESLTTLLVEKTTASWSFWFGLLHTYVKQEGHAHVSVRYKTADGFKLGRWVANQRSGKDSLSAKRVLELESLEGWVWSVLDVKWEEGICCLKLFMRENGHSRVPLRYKAKEGFTLGSWVRRQRANRAELEKNKRLKLEKLSGWVWSDIEYRWDQGFLHLTEYTRQHGHARPGSENLAVGGYKLGQWVSTQRVKKGSLSDMQVARLESLNGWSWSELDSKWEEAFSVLMSYVIEVGDSQVPLRHITIDGFNLGQWVGSQRKKRKLLSDDRVLRLESLNGWSWGVLNDEWKRGFECLREYVERTGNARVPVNYKAMDDFDLGLWVRNKRRDRAKLGVDKTVLLELLNGWIWGSTDYKWDQGFAYLNEHVCKYGHARPKKGYLTDDGFNLDRWVRSQRGKRHKNKNRNGLSTEKKKMLESLHGWAWDTRVFAWDQGYLKLEEFLLRNGHVRVPQRLKTADGFNLGNWLGAQRFKKNNLSDEQICRLESLGIEWPKGSDL